jgi:hypothetical protein
MSRYSHYLRRLRPALIVTLVLALLPCPVVHAVEIEPAGLRLPGFGEILSPLVDLVSQFWSKTGGGLDLNGSPQSDEGGGLDPDGAPATAGSEEGGGLDPDGAR